MKAKYLYIIVSKLTGKMLLDCGRLPIFYRKKTAQEVCEHFVAYKIKKILIEDFNKLL